MLFNFSFAFQLKRWVLTADRNPSPRHKGLVILLFVCFLFLPPPPPTPHKLEKLVHLKQQEYKPGDLTTSGGVFGLLASAVLAAPVVLAEAAPVVLAVPLDEAALEGPLGVADSVVLPFSPELLEPAPRAPKGRRPVCNWNDTRGERGWVKFCRSTSMEARRPIRDGDRRVKPQNRRQPGRLRLLWTAARKTEC